LWPAETSQQPISQTTWLKVNPHCNHCLSYKFCAFISIIAVESALHGPEQQKKKSWYN
jgi:hypothetical protein